MSLRAETHLERRRMRRRKRKVQEDPGGGFWFWFNISVIELSRLRSDMDLPASGRSRFLIDSLLALRPPPALFSRPNPPELRCGFPEPPFPQREPVPRRENPALPGPAHRHRCLGASFLIRDILADCRFCSDPGHPEPGAEPIRPGPAEYSAAHAGPAPGLLKKVRKARTAFSEQQLTQLEKSFQNRKYLSVQDRMELAASLQLSDTQVKTWYQNRSLLYVIQSGSGEELQTHQNLMNQKSASLHPSIIS